ncbi:MAG: retropepsin-like aspartic protease, partial [Patescibacteria group bacterium]
RAGRGVRAVFIIDSGATISLIPRGDADLLGIRFSTGKKSIVRGAGDSTFIGYVHSLRVRLAGQIFRAPFIVAERLDVPHILGRDGIFSHFGILLHEAGRRTAFLDTTTDKKAIDSVFS